MKAVILAAGRGTRMLPISDIIPKELLPAYDKPVIRLILDELAAGGISEVAAVTSADKPQLEHYLVGEGVRCIRQGVAGGTGGAVLSTYRSGFLKDEPLMVCYGDDVLTGGTPCTDLIAAYEQHPASAIALLTVVPWSAAPAYGNAEIGLSYTDGCMEITRVDEKRAPARGTNGVKNCNVVVARCILPAGAEGVLEGMALESAHPSLADALERYAGAGQLVGTLLRCRYYDCGSMKGWANLFNARAGRSLSCQKQATRKYQRGGNVRIAGG